MKSSPFHYITEEDNNEIHIHRHVSNKTYINTETAKRNECKINICHNKNGRRKKKFKLGNGVVKVDDRNNS